MMNKYLYKKPRQQITKTTDKTTGYQDNRPPGQQKTRTTGNQDNKQSTKQTTMTTDKHDNTQPNNTNRTTDNQNNRKPQQTLKTRDNHDNTQLKTRTTDKQKTVYNCNVRQPLKQPEQTHNQDNIQLIQQPQHQTTSTTINHPSTATHNSFHTASKQQKEQPLSKQQLLDTRNKAQNLIYASL